MKCENCPAGWEDSSNTENGYECNDCGCRIFGMLNDDCKLSLKKINEKLSELEKYESGQIERPQWVANRFIRELDDSYIFSKSLGIFLPPYPPPKFNGYYEPIHSSMGLNNEFDYGFRKGYEKAKEEANTWNMLTEDEDGLINGIPGDDGQYLFTDGKEIWIDEFENGLDDGVRFDSGRDIREVKAWMELPKLEFNEVHNGTNISDELQIIEA